MDSGPTDFEKSVGTSPKVESTDSHDGEIVYDGHETTSKWDRMGITPASFKRRSLADKHNQLNKTLKTRHLHMIAIGGSIGAGLFVGSGGALSRGGPASLLICFMIIGVVCLSLCLASLSALY